MNGVSPTASSSVSPTARQVWLRSRGVLIALTILLLTAAAVALIRSGEQHGALDPRSADRNGSRAVAELLRDRGVHVTVATTTAEATRAVDAETTVLVARPELLGADQRDRLHAALSGGAGRTVLLAPGAQVVPDLAPDVVAVRPTPTTDALAPRCDADYARRAGTARLGGVGYRAETADGSPPVDACYPSDGLPTLLRVPTAAGDTVITGTAEFLHNEHLDEQGNASLALQLLGSHDRLVWYLPTPTDPAADREGDQGLADLLPDGWLFGSLQLAIALGLAALWRARRLGPLVPERLPVTVPAAEATEGRARLYRQANARDHAAAALRSATRGRLAPALGLPSALADSEDAVLPALARYAGADSSATRALLFGPAPTDDAALVRLADDLDRLEQQIAPAGRPPGHGRTDAPPGTSAQPPPTTVPTDPTTAPTDKDGTS
ncbi:DUF4350 domain-containing protein [Streptomyces sp. TRM70308]|uniref:DUF4350 domain-containing protein n=1 Tax=Streptomyces sp. TRM70308 TaxID=3131932 RepID=UPI003D05DD4D